MDRVKIDNDLSVLNFPPEAHDMQNLAEAGFKAVVNLRQAGEQGEKLSPQAEAEEAREAGLEYLHYPVSPPDLTAAKAKGLAVRLEQLPGPVAIHCASGRISTIAVHPPLRIAGGNRAWTSAKPSCRQCS